MDIENPTLDARTNRRTQRGWMSLLLLAGCGFLYLETFILPATPRAATGDETIYLHQGERMFEGEMIYRDYDHFTFPGTDVLYMALFKLFGVRAWIPQAMLVLVGLGLFWLSIGISSKLLSGALVFLPGFLFLTFPFSAYLDATHHWYSALAATGALAVLLKQRTGTRLAWAGALWGIATCFAQSMVCGVLGFAVFLLWERYRVNEAWGTLLKKEACLFSSYVGVVVGFLSYFVWKAGLRPFLYYTFTFVARYYPADDANTWRSYAAEWPSIHTRANWPDLVAWPLIHFIVPLVYILFFVRCRRESKSQPHEPWEQLMLVSVTGLSLFLTVASAPTWNRLYTVSLPALILLVWFLKFSFPVERVLLRGLWASAVVLALMKPIVTQMRWKAYLDLPTGRTAFSKPAFYEEAAWLAARTRPGNYFFGDQGFSFALRLRNPARVEFVRPTDYTRPEEVQNVLQALEEHKVEFVSWYPGVDDPPDPDRDHLGPLRRYLHSHYVVATTFAGGYEIWERRK